MNNSEIINRILYEFDSIENEDLVFLLNKLSLKLVRWLAKIHPDNRTRKSLLRFSNISIGSGTVINTNFICSDDYNKLLTIGDRVAISPNVTIICSSGPNNSDLNQNNYVKNNLIVSLPVVIEDDVWIGANVVILPGVRIKRQSIIGAGAIVSNDVDSNSIYAGNPAKKIRTI